MCERRRIAARMGAHACRTAGPGDRWRHHDILGALFGGSPYLTLLPAGLRRETGWCQLARFARCDNDEAATRAYVAHRARASSPPCLRRGSPVPHTCARTAERSPLLSNSQSGMMRNGNS